MTVTMSRWWRESEDTRLTVTGVQGGSGTGPGNKDELLRAQSSRSQTLQDSMERAQDEAVSCGSQILSRVEK